MLVRLARVMWWAGALALCAACVSWLAREVAARQCDSPERELLEATAVSPTDATPRARRIEPAVLALRRHSSYIR